MWPGCRGAAAAAGRSSRAAARQQGRHHGRQRVGGQQVLEVPVRCRCDSAHGSGREQQQRRGGQASSGCHEQGQVRGRACLRLRL